MVFWAKDNSRSLKRPYINLSIAFDDSPMGAPSGKDYVHKPSMAHLPVFTEFQQDCQLNHWKLLDARIHSAVLRPPLPISRLNFQASYQNPREIFNKKKYFYSYDLYTMYNLYAALCGCIPIIVPDKKIPIEQWHPFLGERYGLAYGEENIEWAISTRSKMIAKFKELSDYEEKSVQRFIEICNERFFLG